MSNPQFQIFKNSNGIILCYIYGHENAVANAKSYAQKLEQTIGLFNPETKKVEFFYPAKCNAWKPPCIKCGYEHDDIWLDDGETCPVCLTVN